jgi:SAM-dependent methyltransferase
MSGIVNYIERNTCEMPTLNDEGCHKNWEMLRHIHDEDTGADFDIIYCHQCKVAFTNPYPEEATIKYLYEGRTSITNFDFIFDSIIDKLKDYYGKRSIKKIIPKEERAKARHVLDYGTGNGRYAVLSSQIFPVAEVDAVDYQTELPDYLLRKKFPRIRYRFVDEFWNTDQKYDFIILRHVLEHNHHPVAFIKAFRDRLTPHGILFIEVPNLNSWYARKASNFMNSYSVPFHIFHYTVVSLKQVLYASGLESDIHTSEMPLMGGVFQAIFNLKRSIFTQLVGVALNPLQIIFSEIYGAPCLDAVCRIPQLK